MLNDWETNKRQIKFEMLLAFLVIQEFQVTRCVPRSQEEAFNFSSYHRRPLDDTFARCNRSGELPRYTDTRTKRTCNVVYINCVLLCMNRSEESERGFSQSLRACNFDRGIDLLIDQRTACWYINESYSFWFFMMFETLIGGGLI